MVGSSVNALLERPAEPRSSEPSEPDRIAMAIHDLKTPLAALQQALQVLSSGRAGALSESQRRFVGMGLNNAAILGSLMDRLPGTLRSNTTEGFRPSRVSVPRTLGFVVETLQASAELRGVRLQARAAPNLPDAWVDEELLHRLVLNLVGNAIKYGATGGIASVSIERQSPEDGFLTLSVLDHGPGVATEDLAHVFEPRYRSDASAAEHEGKGLGLAIVRDIALAHGGEASVRNNPGAGCTFTVTLPEFGTGRGAIAHASRVAAAACGRLELVVFTARVGAAARVADALSQSASGWGAVIDLGARRFGILRVASASPSDPSALITSLLAGNERAIESAGVASAPAAGFDALELVAAAHASSRSVPLDPARMGAD